MDFDFAELKNDVNFVSNVKATTEAIANIEEEIEKVSQIKLEDLTAEDKVKHDIFLTYAINSLFWMYLKINGENPNTVRSNNPLWSKPASKISLNFSTESSMS